MLKQRPGFFPIIGLVTTAFLAVAVFVGTAIVSNPDNKFDLRNFAKQKDKKEEKVTCPTECDGNIKYVYDRATNSCKKRESKECTAQAISAKKTQEAVPNLKNPCAGACVVGGSCADKGLQNSTGDCVKGFCCSNNPVPKNQPSEETASATGGDSAAHLAAPAKPEISAGAACIQNCVTKGGTAYACASQCNVDVSRPTSGQTITTIPAADTETTKDTGSAPHLAAPVKPITCIQQCVNDGGTAYKCAEKCNVVAKRPETAPITVATVRCDAAKIKTCTKGCQPTDNGGVCVEDLAGGPAPTLSVGADCIQACINLDGTPYQCASDCGVLATRPITPTISELEPDTNVKANGNNCTSNDECLSGYCETGLCQLPPLTATLTEEELGLTEDGERIYHGMVYYSQGDSQWANLAPQNAKNRGGCGGFVETGCGPSVAAALISTYTTNKVNPYDLSSQYPDDNNCGLTSFEENMAVLEDYGFETEQYRGSLYKIGRYLQDVNYDESTGEPAVDNRAWLTANFTYDVEGGTSFGHHSLIVEAQTNYLGETVSLTLNDPYLGPDVHCDIVGGDRLSCLTADNKHYEVEDIGTIIIDPTPTP